MAHKDNKSKQKQLKTSLEETGERLKKKQLQKGSSGDKSLFRLEDGITYSALSKWSDCPEQFALSYMDGLTLKRISVPLEFGSIFHLCLEHQWKYPTLTPIQVARKITSAYKKGRGKTLINTNERETLDSLIMMVEATYPLYCEHWKSDDAGIQWVQREDKFNVVHTIPNPAGDGAAIKVRLRGMRDGVIKINGKLGIFETKTKSRVNENDIRDGLKADMQTMMYAQASYIQLGQIPETILYNVIRRSSMYRRKEESMTSWCKRLVDDIKKRPDYYFLRWEVTLTKTDLSRFVSQTLNPLLLSFIRWHNSVKKNPKNRFLSPYHFLNCNALFGKYGRSDMWDAVHGRLKSYKTRSSVFPELEESFVDIS